MLWLALGCAAPGWELPEAPTSGPEQACSDDGQTLACEHLEGRYRDGALDRTLRWQLPAGEAPDAGWPVVVVFQGSGHSCLNSFESERDARWGGWWQAQLTAALLEAGFAVLAPGTRLDGTWWDTNVLPWSASWERSRDHRWMEALFAAIDSGELGPLDPDALHATGISSGGYMTSRMAVSYPGRFEALAIQSAGYASCSGLVCRVPELPGDHPPTLFLHGEQDEIVPVGTLDAYVEGLEALGVAVAVELDPQGHHGWLESAPEVIPGFFVDAPDR